MAQEAQYEGLKGKIRRLEEELLGKEREIGEWRCRWEDKNRELKSYNRELLALKELYKERARELRTVMEKLEEVSITDDLTMIYNHRYLISRLSYEFERARRYGFSIALIMLDIDHFKVYNDNNGHLAGDDALRKVAGLIDGAIRETDIVGRYGGEEFAVILLHADLIKMAEIAERIRRTIEEAPFPNEELQPMGKITVSIGGSCLSDNMETMENLIKSADEALYKAKRNGRNQVTIEKGLSERGAHLHT
ncbi:MAG: GGDEF domain-containing protein [Syntrophobacterales bacterium]|nr:MAG: GGDEF domain-containing protein [Syntrophobacterales bacterium]